MADLHPENGPVESAGGESANQPDVETKVKTAEAAAPAGQAPSAPHGPAHGQQPPQQELVRPGMHWYVLRVASNRESQVRDALERKVAIEQLEARIGRILVPTQREKRIRGGTARVVQKKLYPGYVFVEMATESDGSIAENVWFTIKETSGVGDFIGSGGKPSPMDMPEVEKMLASTLAPQEQPGFELAFKKGDKVKVREGPFENFEGVVDELNAQKGTVRVIVTIFGRATPIEIEYWQIEPIA